jgi:ATP synthase protein I
LYCFELVVGIAAPYIGTLTKPFSYVNRFTISMPLSKDERKRLVGDLRLYGSLGIEMAASVLIGTLIGYWADKWLGTRPWILIIGFVFGAAAGFRNLYRFITKEDPDRGKDT